MVSCFSWTSFSSNFIAYRPIRNSNTRNLEPIFTKYLEWIAFERSLDLEAAIDCKHSTKWKAWRTKLFFKVLLEENQFCLILLPKKQHTKLCNEPFYQSTTNVSPSIGETATMFF